MIAQWRRRDGKLELSGAREIVDSFFHHCRFERCVILEIRQQLEHGTRIEQGAGKTVRTRLARFLQHVDIVFGERSVGMLGVMFVDQLRQAQRTGHAGGTSADDDHIRFHRRTLDIGQWLTEYDHAPFAFFTSSISGGTISNRLPTTAMSAISKIGASESLLMAMMLRDPFIPTTC